MRHETYRVDIMDGDISLIGRNVQYATIGNLCGLQCNFASQSEDYKKLLELMNQAAPLIMQINDLLCKEVIEEIEKRNSYGNEV